MGRFFRQQVTPPEFDHAIGLIAGVVCSVFGIAFILNGDFWFAIALLAVAAGPIFHAWRFLRR